MSKLTQLKKAYENLPRPKTKEVGGILIKAFDTGQLCVSTGMTERGNPAFILMTEDECLLLFKYMQTELGFK